MELVLSPAEQQSPLGQKLHSHFTERLQRLREANDKSMPAEDRAVLLAQIKEAKLLIQALERQPLLRTVAPV